MRFPAIARKIPDTPPKFPVPILREFVTNLLNWREDSAENFARLTKSAKFPCIFPVKQGIQAETGSLETAGPTTETVFSKSAKEPRHRAL